MFPAQRWDKLKWFLPYVNKTGKYFKSLYKDGGRACNLYVGPTVNPAVELNVIFGGLLSADIKRDIDDILEEIINELYKPQTDRLCSDLLGMFTKAENAYFDNWTPSARPFDSPNADDVIGAESISGVQFPGWSESTPERSIPGELKLEPLGSKSKFPGPPSYLLDKNMDCKGRSNYKRELTVILDKLLQFNNGFNDSGRIKRMIMCINNVLKDLEMIEHIESIEVKNVLNG